MFSNNVCLYRNIGFESRFSNILTALQIILFIMPRNCAFLSMYGTRMLYFPFWVSFVANYLCSNSRKCIYIVQWHWIFMYSRLFNYFYKLCSSGVNYSRLQLLGYMFGGKNASECSQTWTNLVHTAISFILASCEVSRNTVVARVASRFQYGVWSIFCGTECTYM